MFTCMYTLGRERREYVLALGKWGGKKYEKGQELELRARLGGRQQQTATTVTAKICHA